MNLRNPVLLLILFLSACKGPVSLFNHVPKDYYTRHHSNEVKAQKREPILCLKQSKKEDLPFYAKNKNAANEGIEQDFSVSKNTFEPPLRQNLWDIYNNKNYSENKYEEHSEVENNKKQKLSNIFGWSATALGIAGVFTIFIGPVELFLTMAITAVGLGIASSSISPRKKLEEQKRNIKTEKQELQEDKKVVLEPLTKEERKALDVEKLGFFSSAAGIFSLVLTALAFGPYNSLIIVAFIPFLALIAMTFGSISLIKFRENPHKFRGKGYAIFGIGLSSLLVFAALAIIIAFLISY